VVNSKITLCNEVELI